MWKIGLVGVRGLVGATLINRLFTQRDLDDCDTTLFDREPELVKIDPPPSVQLNSVKHSLEITELAKQDLIFCCAGSDYARWLETQLSLKQWTGYLFDASSAFRTQNQCQLVLDPLNHHAIWQALIRGKKIFSSANCTVSLLLLALSGLIKANVIDWICTMTYQAISGAGATALQTLRSESQLAQTSQLSAYDFLATMTGADQPTTSAHNAVPWIDCEYAPGLSKEEWKLQAELNRLIDYPIQIDGLCVRIDSWRCHSQALTIQLKRHVPLEEIAQRLAESPFVKVIPNHLEPTMTRLHPVYMANQLEVAIGRLRYLNLGNHVLGAFTVGDQLLWGAAEPLRRSFLIWKQFASCRH